MRTADWKMKTQHLIALVFVCQMVLVVEGQVVEGETHKVWISPLAIRYSASVKDANDTEDDLQEDNQDLRNSPHYLVELPTLYCDYDEQCMAQNIDLICVEGECTCRPPLCWVYQYEVTGFFTAKYVFTCEKCGILGSRCNDTNECFYPGECWEDDFCHCPSGENYDGVCYSYKTSWSSTLAMSAIGLIIVCAVCILGVNCYLDPPWRNPDAWRCRCCSSRAETSRGRGRVRRGSCEKSPAYTIQLHYASRDNTAFENDPQDAVLVGAQGGIAQQHRGRSSGSVEESANSGTVSSVSSANTNVTTVSRTESTDTSPPSHPPPPYSTLPPSSHNARKSPPRTGISLSSPPPADDAAAALPPYALDGPSTSYASCPSPPVSHNPPSPLPRSPHYAVASPSTSLGDPTPPPLSGSGQSSSVITPPSSPNSSRSISSLVSPSSLTPPPSPDSPRSLAPSSSGPPSSSSTPNSPRSSSSSLAPSSLTPPSSASNSPRLSSSSLGPPSRNYSKSHKKSSVDNDESDIQLKEITPKSPSSPRSTDTSQDAPGNVSMSCTHERCQLCLPRSPSSRPPPPTIAPRRKPKPKPKPRTDDSVSYISHQEDIQLTQL